MADAVSTLTELNHTLQPLLTVQSAAHANLAPLPDSEPLSGTFCAVTNDSRAVTSGTIFVATQGGQIDSHRFIPHALRLGAVGIIGMVTPSDLAQLGVELPESVPYWQVHDSRRALAIASALLHHFPSRHLTVVGITGTDGKTSTATLLESILHAAQTTAAASSGPHAVGVITTVAARIAGVEQDTGFHVTTPDAPAVQHYLAQMRDAGCRWAIVESTSHGLAQARVAAVEYDVAAVTNITHEHLDYHGSREAYVTAKALLFRGLFASPRKPGVPRVAVLNADDAGSIDALSRVLTEEQAASSIPVDIWRYGLAGGPLSGTPAQNNRIVLATDIVYTPERTRFTVHWPGGRFELESRLIGEFNVYNILCAVTIALAQGVEPHVIQAGVAQLSGVLGRMERIECGQPFLALVDFAHSPASLERALMTLRAMLHQNGGHGRLIAVFGSAGLRDREKRGLMGQVSGRLADFTVITAEDPRTEDLTTINVSIARGVLDNAPATRFAIVPDRAAAIQYAVDMAGPGDIVATFGKGHERSMCFGETEFPWSDQDTLAAALTRRVAQRV